MTLLARAARFGLAYAVLAGSYAAAAGTAVERFVIETLTVAPAAALVAALAPDTLAEAHGARITSPRASVTVLGGCEGIDAMLLVVAAFAAVPMVRRARCAGVAAGLVLAYTANQVRVVALFFATRDAPSLFGLLHGFVLPLAMVATLGGWFVWFAQRHGVAP